MLSKARNGCAGGRRAGTPPWPAFGPGRRTSVVVFAMAVLAVMAAGCASYGPAALSPGAGLDAVRRTMGEPTAEHPLDGGGRRLEYARGPMGRHTYMLDLGPDGRLVRATQVLDEAQFDAIRIGMPAGEVRRRIGRPSDIRRVGVSAQTVWAYRYEALFCRWFELTLDAQGRVDGTGYGVDPLCHELNEPDPA